MRNALVLVRAAMGRLRVVAWRAFSGWRYKELGRRSRILCPLQVTPRFIRLKDGVFIHKHGRIQGIDWYQGTDFFPEIIFDEGASAQQNLHLTCAGRVYIGRNTALAANVTVTDINHPYEDIQLPIERQRIEVSPVSIGNDCKIYNNAVILPGTTIGDHCVVGANSVVSGTFKSRSVIVGAPARVVKRYDSDSASWVVVPPGEPS